jgi:hypothetical protein
LEAQKVAQTVAFMVEEEVMPEGRRRPPVEGSA